MRRDVLKHPRQGGTDLPLFDKGEMRAGRYATLLCQNVSYTTRDQETVSVEIRANGP